MIPSTTIHQGDCLEVLRTMPDGSVDSIVTDPPYGLKFMGKAWDYDVPPVEVWRECLRVLKPGGHLLAFAGTRTQHRMAVRIENAGFEIRDMIAWVYGSGFPKSHNLEDQWQGWGTALKPAMEPITVARKPLIGTVAENVLTHGTGALNVDGCRVGTCEDTGRYSFERKTSKGSAGGSFGNQNREKHFSDQAIKSGGSTLGRWPANLIHDGSEEVVKGFPETQSGVMKAGTIRNHGNHVYGLGCSAPGKIANAADTYADSGSAARFFYCAKASAEDRGEGNNHPTVKPTELMRYLVRLVTPPRGTVLDPYTGSGSTGRAATIEGFNFIGVEMDPAFVEIAKQRCNVTPGLALA